MTSTNTIRTILALSHILLFSISASSQISFGGTPPSLSAPGVRSAEQQGSSITTIKVAPKEDIQFLKKMNSYAKENMAPPVVASLIDTTINLTQSGTWTQIGNDSICRITINAPGAEGINLYYSHFEIPPKGKLFIYNNTATQILGAYTLQTKAPSQKRFATEFIFDSKLTLEYVHPIGNPLPKIIISAIGYGFDLGTTFSLLKRESDIGNADNCMININCSPEGDQWQQQKKGVAKLIVPIGRNTYYCSGSLINNTQQDHTPYFLSAYHCFYQNSVEADFSQTLFYFHFESTDCTNNTLSDKMRTLVGGTLLVNSPLNGGSDGTLLRINSDIPSEWDVYYNGWDTSEEAPRSGVAIHHPQGDLKKISTYSSPATTVTFTDAGTSSTSISGGHWSITYSATTNGLGVTQGGSSGSPLFNQERRIVGTLTGGGSSCSSPSLPDFYGKFSLHWTTSTSTTTMADYLNPSRINISGINGISSLETATPLTDQSFITIQPYVSGGYLRIQSSAPISEIKVYNLKGQLITKEYTPPISTLGWPSGVYIVVVETSRGRETAKVLINATR